METAERFKRLFAGLDRVHGTYRVTSSREDGKQTGKAVTKTSPVTVELWQNHLDGKQGIGIVPVRDDAMCVFGAVDVDVYEGETAVDVQKKIADANLPLQVCRSKSGGAHCYLFASEPVPAELMRLRLREVSVAIGRSGAEIFPAQNKIQSEKDCGSWINMPYFGGVDGSRYAVRLDGSAMSTEDFLDFAEAVRRPLKFFETPIEAPGEVFSDGPPCLQTLARLGGFSQGARNHLLFNASVYAKMAFGDDWRDRLYQINKEICSPPVDKEEFLGATGSAKSKPYLFGCKKEPMSSHCDGKLCRMRAYGVGKNGQHGDGGGEGKGDTGGEGNASFPRLGQLRKLLTEPPLWFWDTTTGRTIELTTEQLQSPRLFQARCMDAINLMPTMPAQQTWQTFVNEALSRALEIETPEDSSDDGQVWELLEKFCTGRVQAQNKKEILLGKPWTSEGTTWFRLSDFRTYLDRQHFRSDSTKTHKLSALFHKRGLEKKFDVFDKKENKGANIWGVPSFTADPEMDVPKSVGADETPF